MDEQLPPFQQRIKLLNDLVHVFEERKVESEELRLELALNLLCHLGTTYGVPSQRLIDGIKEYYMLNEKTDKIIEAQNIAGLTGTFVGEYDPADGKITVTEILGDKPH